MSSTVKGETPNLSLPNSPRRLGFGFFWQFGLVAAFFPMLPIYFDDLGVSASDIAFLISVQALTALCVSQFYGYLADALMRRTTLLMLMTMMSSLMAALFPRLPANIWWLSLGMVGLALFFNQRVMLYNSLVLDSQRGEELYGRMRVIGSLSFAMLSLLIGWLSDMPMFTPAVMWPMMVLFELMFALALTLLRDVPPRERPGEIKRLSFRRAQRILLGNPLIRRFLLFMLIYQLAGGPPHVLQIKLLRDIGTTAVFATACLGFAALSEMVTFFFGNQILRRVRLMPLLALLPVGVFLRYGMIAASPTPLVIFVSNAFHLITFGLAFLCGVIFIHREAPRELKSSAQTIFGLVFSTIAVFAGHQWNALLLGVLTNRFGLNDGEALRVMFGVAAVIVLLAFIPWVPLKRAYEAKHQVSGVWVR